MDIWGIIYCASAVFCFVSVVVADIVTDTFRNDGRTLAIILSFVPVANTIIMVILIYMLFVDIVRTRLGKQRLFF